MSIVPLTPLRPVDTRPLFRPVSSALVSLLRELPAADWQKTAVGRWMVRDVAAHILDVTLRRLSFHRDRMEPPPPPTPIRSDADFVDFINTINAQWVDASRRLSPRVLTDSLERATAELSDWFESLPIDAPALFGVSWAGEMESEGWFDIAREFVELWHHQEQIRLAVGAGSLDDPRYLRAVIDVAIRGLPHAYRTTAGEGGETVVVEVTGAAGGVWTLSSSGGRWTLHAGEPAGGSTRVRMSDADAWKLFCNGLPAERASEVLDVEGASQLAAPLLRARSVIV
jgi:uncharacterized protein (TIGR03083 family)